MKVIKYCLIFLNITLLAGQLAVAHFRATDGDQVAVLESRAAVLVQFNRRLEANILTASSLEQIQKVAGENGLQALPVTTFAPPPVAIAP